MSMNSSHPSSKPRRPGLSPPLQRNLGDLAESCRGDGCFSKRGSQQFADPGWSSFPFEWYVWGLSISTPIWACLPLPGRTPNPRLNLKIVTVVAKLNQFRLYIESGHCYGAWWWINDPFIHSCVLCWFYQQECRRLVSSIWGSVVFACLSWSHLL